MLLTILLQAVASEAIGKIGIALGAAIAALAAGYGIGKIGSSATESIAVSLKQAEISVLQ